MGISKKMGLLTGQRLAAALLSATFSIPVFAAGDFQAGLEAFGREDYATALEAWLPLADDGDLNAMYNVGLIFDEGLGVGVDKSQALRWYLPPAEAGDVAAQFNVAVIYDFGDGVPENNKKALFWYTQAAQQADEQAQYNLGLMYATGEGTPTDIG